MKKSIFLFTAALLGLVLLTSCNGDGGTWETNKDNRWWAGEDGSKLFGYIDENGKMVIPANYSSVCNFSCGWACVLEDGENQFIDKDGKSVIPDPFPVEGYFNFNRIRFQEDGKKGMYDENWKVVIPADYKSLGECTEDGLIWFSEDGKEWGYLDKDGKVVIPEQFAGAYSFAGGIAVVFEKKDEEYRYGVIDKKGNFLIDFQKKFLNNLGEGRVSFKNASTGKYGMMDKNGNEIVSAKYDNINPFTCGLARVKKGDKFGFINTKGEEVIPCRYYNTYAFYGDVADVQKSEDSRWEIIDKKGESLITLKENEYLAYCFINGLGLVYNEATNQYRYINKKNEIIYKWEPGSSSMPEKRLSPEERRMQFMLSTEYGPLFLDMMRKDNRLIQ
ncbi:MAG: WG repeat-containing protein [Paludibacteraceae bacterium]|nr:WG repeat-containing protein [Paludibacteraceae bacterium]